MVGRAARETHIWKIVTVVFFGPFLSILSATTVNVSLSTLGEDLDTSIGTIQWVASGYLLALALMLPLTGWMVDRFGAKRMYLGCFAAFTIASTLCGFAETAPVLITFRVLQGMAGGLIAPMAQMMAARHAGDNMARVMGFVGFPVMLAPILGPVVAGAILEHASWHWIFFINAPFGVAAIALAALLLPKDEELNPRPLDLTGFFLISPGLVLLLDGVQGMTGGGNDALRGFEIGAGVVLVGMFIRRSRQLGKAALVDLRLFGRRTFAVAASAQFLANAGSFGGQLILPLYYLTARDVAPMATGLLLLPLGVGMAVSLPLMGRAVGWFGARRVAIGGTTLAFLGTVPFVFVGQEWPLWFLVAVLFVRGVGLGAIGVPSLSLAYSSVPKSELANATTAVNIVQRLGGPVGTVALALLFQHLVVQSQSAAFSAAFALLCAMHLLCAAVVLFLPRR